MTPHRVPVLSDQLPPLCFRTPQGKGGLEFLFSNGVTVMPSNQVSHSMWPSSSSVWQSSGQKASVLAFVMQPGHFSAPPSAGCFVTLADGWISTCYE